MDGLRLRQMTPEEFDVFRSRIIREYGAAHVAAGDWSADTAEELAAKQIDGFLPEGADTPGMLLLSAETADGGLLGTAWVGLKHPEKKSGAWIYKIEIVREHRGKGWGRALLRAVEQETARQDGTEIGLNVFGANIVARGLYESSGYKIASLHMLKDMVPWHWH